MHYGGDGILVFFFPNLFVCFFPKLGVQKDARCCVFPIFVKENTVFELLKGSKMMFTISSDFSHRVKRRHQHPSSISSSPSSIGAAASGRRTHKGGRRPEAAPRFVASCSAVAAVGAAALFTDTH